MSSNRAVVIGASIAGLLAAAALAEHADEVVVVDRDTLPVDATPRAGAPQSRHVHGLLARGREAMEELLPGLTDELVGQGARLGDFQQSAGFLVGGRPLARAASGLLTLAVSRALLERQVRRRVEALPNVSIRDRTAVLGLALDPASGPGSARVVGVRVSHLDWPGTSECIDAALVVDASGRNSRAPEWLDQAGYDQPVEEHVRIDVCYATRSFRRHPDDLGGDLALIESVGEVVPRSALIVAQEDDRWIAGITGYFGDRPPTDLPGFLAFAATCEGPLAEILAGLEPLDDGATYRFPANVRRRYERLARFPAGLLVTGDAICAFDPAYGQGMTVAALEALELRGVLRESAGARAGLGDLLAAAFFRRAAGHVDTPWMLVVGRDLELPGSTQPVPLRTRLVNRYVRALLGGATTDPVLATAFLRVSHLVAPPQTLFAPGVVARVIRARWTGRTEKSTGYREDFPVSGRVIGSPDNSAAPANSAAPDVPAAQR